MPGGWAQMGCHSWNPPHSSLPGLPTWLQLAAGVFLQCRCGGGEWAPGPWHYLARMLGAVEGGAKTSGLPQPCSGPQKVGSGMAGLPGSWVGLSGEDDEHLAHRISKEPGCRGCPGG